MELIFVTVIGVALGVIVRYTIPGRRTHGVLLLPAIGGVVTAAVWVGLVWLGWAFDGGWIWAASLGAAIAVCVLVAALLPPRRRAHDAERFQQLSRAARQG